MNEKTEKTKKSVKAELPKPSVEKSAVQSSYSKIAVVRVRGVRNMEPKIKYTLELLRLSRPHHCVLIATSPQNMGMINVVKDYIAFGPVKDETVAKLIEKRGEKGKIRFKDYKGAEKVTHDPVFRLHPPRKGYKDIKSNYPRGDLGKRPDMDDLLTRMM